MPQTVMLAVVTKMHVINHSMRMRNHCMIIQHRASSQRDFNAFKMINPSNGQSVSSTRNIQSRIRKAVQIKFYYMALEDNYMGLREATIKEEHIKDLFKLDMRLRTLAVQHGKKWLNARQ